MVGGYNFLRWPLRLLFDHASGPHLRNANYAASRFFAAIISAWFSLDILNYTAIAKFDTKNSKQAAKEQQHGVANSTGLILQTSKNPNAKDINISPPVLAGKTIDLTLLAVTRALDSLVVNLYRWYHPMFANNVAATSVSTIISQSSDTVIFALSSGTVVRVQYRPNPSLPNLACKDYLEGMEGGLR